MTVAQLLGYRGVFVNLGPEAIARIWPEDYLLFSDYLTADFCSGDRRGLIFNASNAGTGMDSDGLGLLTNQFGASLVDNSYREYAADDAFCVQIEAPVAGGEAYGTSHSGGDYVYSAYGSGCPSTYNFDVLTPLGTGVGNRVYVDEASGLETAFAQIVNEGPSPYNYRTVLDGTSWSVLAGRDGGGDCVIAEADRIEAAANEIRAAVEWIYGAQDFTALCESPCEEFDISSVGGGGPVAESTRLLPSAPNPFNPRTTLRYSLAADGPVTLAIFDVSGRLVRTVVDGMQSAGAHEMVWDGVDDRGNRLGSGTYWVRLTAVGRASASRLVLLR